MKSENGLLSFQDRRAALSAYVQTLYDRGEDGRNSSLDQAGLLPLDSIIGIPQLVADLQQRLRIRAGYPLRCAARRWSDILAAAAGGVYVWNRALAAELVSKGFDPLMYETYRDILPPRAGRAESIWRADLVVYRDGLLPTGELYRSVGHWNPIDEWEIFQVCRGEAVMMAGYRQADGSWSVQATWCGVGEGCIIRPGSWHLTYALADNPIIMNVYSCNSSQPDDSAHSPLFKYATRSHHGPEFALLQRATLPPAGVLWTNDREIKVPLDRAKDDAFLGLIKLSRYKWLGSWFAQSYQSELEAGFNSFC